MRYEQFAKADMGDHIAPETVNAAHCPLCGFTMRIIRDETNSRWLFAPHRISPYSSQLCSGSATLVPKTATLTCIDHKWTTEIICPWCAYSVRPDCGPEEWQGCQRCQNCDQPFDCDYEVEVTYDTQRISPEAFAERERLRKEAWQKKQSETLARKEKP